MKKLPSIQGVKKFIGMLAIQAEEYFYHNLLVMTLDNRYSHASKRFVEENLHSQLSLCSIWTDPFWPIF